jgi:predicted nucleotidyltransferase
VADVDRLLEVDHFALRTKALKELAEIFLRDIHRALLAGRADVDFAQTLKELAEVFL